MEPSFLIFMLRSLDICYDRVTLQRCLDFLVKKGFRLIADTEERKYEQVIPEVSTVLQHNIDAYLAHQINQLTIEVYSLGDYAGDIDLYFALLLVPSDTMLACEVEWELFWHHPDAPSYLALLDIYKELYRIWQPFYAYQKYSSSRHLNRNEIRKTQNPGYLYEINFFGSEIVHTLGRERLLATPAWKVEELDDGGIFLLVEEQVEVEGKRYSMRKIAEHLGLQTPQAPGEEWEEDDEDEDEE